MYSLKHDPASGNDAQARSIYSADAINEGFGGFLRTYDVTDHLHKITAPTLVIGAAHDWICAAEIASKIPNADLRMFEHSGHSVITDEHQAFLDVIRGFITHKH